jgi:hypothetical protein
MIELNEYKHDSKALIGFIGTLVFIILVVILKEC